jgi:preprotein translocase subunit SecF
MTSVLDSDPTTDTSVPGVDRRHRPADFYHERTNFRFMRHQRTLLIAFVAVVLVSLGSLYFRGLNLGIDFEGGVSWQVDVAEGREATVAEVRDLIEPLGFGASKVTTTRSAQDDTTTIRVQSEELPDDPIKTIRDAIAEATDSSPADVTADIAGRRGSFSVAAVESADQAAIEDALNAVDGVDAVVTVTPAVEGSNVTVVVEEVPASPRDEVTEVLAEYAGVEVQDVSINTVGPTWGEEVTRKALTALGLFFLVLAVYLSLRFEFKMAAAAIVAVVHDIIFTVGVYAIVGFEVTPATVTAFLTILGFSLYDTVVVFDKVKENSVAVGTRLTYADMVDRSLNQVLMRSLSTSLVALLPIVSLLVVGSIIMGATALEDFALALFAGLFIGTYSSIFVAAPMLCWWKEREPAYRAVRDKAARTAASASAVAAPVGAVSAATDSAAPVSASEWDTTGIPGPPPVRRTIEARPRTQRRKRR